MLEIRAEVRGGIRRCRLEGSVDDASLLAALRRLWGDLGFGLLRMYPPYVHGDRGDNIGVFRDEAPALAWLRGRAAPG